jgi:hypothetical protein
MEMSGVVRRSNIGSAWLPRVLAAGMVWSQPDARKGACYGATLPRWIDAMVLVVCTLHSAPAVNRRASFLIYMIGKFTI